MNALNLPICNIPMTLQELTYHELINNIGEELEFTIHENSKINEFISDMVGADCIALTNTIIDSDMKEPTEILFNNYKKENCLLKEIIMNNFIRDMIIKDPRRNLLFPLYRYDMSANIDIYMFYQHPYRIQINYNSDDKLFTINSFMSEAYKQKYVLNE